MIGVMALIVMPLFLIVSARNMKISPDYPKNGIKHFGRYLVLGLAGLIILADIAIIIALL